MLTEEEVKKTPKLDARIEEILDQLEHLDCGEESYGKIADQLLKLYKAKELEVGLRLKIVETFTKQADTTHGQQLKDQEAEVRRNEIDARIADIAQTMRLRETEIDQTMRLRELETEAKLCESAANCEMKAAEIEGQRLDNQVPRNRVSKDTMAVIAANLVGIVTIIGYERLNVLTSKALGFVLKLK